MEDSEHNISALDKEMPEIFQFQFMPSDVQNIYTNILGDAQVCEVFDAMSNYIGSNIEPLGWKAIWKPTSSEYPNGTSFRVNVVDVFYKTLEASVVIMDMIFPNIKDLTGGESEKIQPFLKKTEVFTVPLVDLFVISSDEDESDFNNTAYLIELVRLFYKSIWRPWDDLDENAQSEDFVPTRLIPRLTLIWDMKNKILSEGFINRFNAILTEAFATKDKMTYLNNKFTENGDFQGDTGDFATELDAAEYIRLKMKLQDLEREMKIIEDHHLRSLYYTLMPERVDIDFEQTCPTIHLVSKNFAFNSLSTFMAKISNSIGANGRIDWPVKIQPSLQKAIVSSKSGDVIYLSPGIYDKPLSWIEKDIEIIGIGNNVELLSHQDCGDIFLFINCESVVKLSNLTIRANHELNHLIVVKNGCLSLDKCTLDCNNMTLMKPILVVPNGASIDKQNYTEVVNNSHSESE